jgi:peptidoglycan hydrolase-like protein with peptidoglycan-binding domain/predicted nucleotidyltransferase
MSNLKNILNSFHLKDELNPKIWKSSGNDEKTMNPKVRARLLDIAYEFIEFLKVDVVVSDIIMTGSLANYNWSTFSDIDLHILVDFNQFPESQLPLYTELFTLKKTMYNDKHNITIYGYEVELYIQNESEAHFSSGVYSVLHDEWINKSKKENVEIDTNLIKNKATKWMEIIDGALENAQDEPLDDAKKLIQKYKDKIKKYRTCGLEKDGEYSDENLVFKVLRRNGYMQKLFDFENEYTDKKLSIKESTTNIGGTFLSDLEKISKSGKEYMNLKNRKSKISYDKDVEKIQIALQFLGYSLPKWGVDGLYGPETESAVVLFELGNGINPDGKLSEEDITKLIELLISKNFKDSDLSKIQTKSNFKNINVGNDKDFYTEILTGVGAPITDENLKFFYAWRKGEGGKATNNPFNTTFKLSKDSGISNYNSAGVKNYSTPNYGIEATVKTLLLPYYTCITNGLKNDIGSDKLSKCESLKTWGTGDLVAKVLSKDDITPPKIYT